MIKSKLERISIELSNELRKLSRINNKPITQVSRDVANILRNKKSKKVKTNLVDDIRF